MTRGVKAVSEGHVRGRGGGGRQEQVKADARVTVTSVCHHKRVRGVGAGAWCWLTPRVSPLATTGSENVDVTFHENLVMRLAAPQTIWYLSLS